jgi:hypothetical protein
VKKLLAVFSFFAAVWALTTPGAATASESQVIENEKEICARQIARTERKMGIPRRLLSAISLAESGRWDKSRRAIVAWPWTVTSGGQGRYFDTKAEALAEVEFLMTDGVRNIDVGCMQINLYYHANAFASLAEALDPAANVTYGARFLKKLYSGTGDWGRAVGQYHSSTPERSGPYKDKVLAYWRGQGGWRGQDDTPAPTAANAPPAPIDYTRMARLNDRFRARAEARNGKEESVPQTQAEALKATISRQLKAWRDASSRGVGMGRLLAMQRAEQKLKLKREMDRLGSTDKNETFAQRRAQQLKSWRLRVAGQGTGGWETTRVTPRNNSSLSATGMAAASARAGVR